MIEGGHELNTINQSQIFDNRSLRFSVIYEEYYVYLIAGIAYAHLPHQPVSYNGTMLV